jgi:hypothetical protein
MTTRKKLGEGLEETHNEIGAGDINTLCIIE